MLGSIFGALETTTTLQPCVSCVLPTNMDFQRGYQCGLDHAPPLLLALAGKAMQLRVTGLDIPQRHSGFSSCEGPEL